VNQLFARELRSLAADERSNTLIVRASPQVLPRLKPIIGPASISRQAAPALAGAGAGGTAAVHRPQLGTEHGPLAPLVAEEIAVRVCNRCSTSRSGKRRCLSREILSFRARRATNTTRRLATDLRNIGAEAFGGWTVHAP